MCHLYICAASMIKKVWKSYAYTHTHEFIYKSVHEYIQPSDTWWAEELVCSPSPMFLAQLLGNQALTEPAAQAVEVQWSRRPKSSDNVNMSSEALRG